MISKIVNDLRYIDIQRCTITKVDIFDNKVCLYFNHINVHEMHKLNPSKTAMLTGEAKLIIEQYMITDITRQKVRINTDEIKDAALSQDDIFFDAMKNSKAVHLMPISKKEFFMSILDREGIFYYKIFFSFKKTSLEWSDFVEESITPAIFYEKNLLIKQIFDLNPKPMIDDAMSKLVKISDEDMHQLIMPRSSGCWENAAKILTQIGYPRIMVVVQGLLAWIMDMNWMGAHEIFNLLKTIPRDDMAKEIDIAIDKAIGIKDGGWLCWMYDLITEMELNKTIKGEICKKPKKDILIFISILAMECSYMEIKDLISIKRVVGEMNNQRDNECLNWLLEIAKQAEITQADFEGDLG